MAKVPTIYARVSQADKDFIKELIQKHSTSENYIIETLISYFRELPKEDQREILEGSSGSTVRKAGELMERLAWAQHAFMHKRWGWALEEYRRLEDESDRADGTWRFAQYKSGYCWLDLAIDARKAALLSDSPDDWVPYYDGADWALRASIAYNERHATKGRQKRDTGSEHPVVGFNLACAWALRAQYLIERTLGRDSTALEPVRASLTLKKEQAAERNAAFANYFDTWRTELESRDENLFVPVERRADSFGRQAMQMLVQVSQIEQQRQPPFDTKFLVGLAREDSDLSFLRCDLNFSEKFKEWWSREIASRPVLEEIIRLQDLVPDEVQKRIEELA